MSTAGKAVCLSTYQFLFPSSREPAESRALLGSATSGTPTLQMGRLKPSALSWVRPAREHRPAPFLLTRSPTRLLPEGWLGCSLELCCSLVNPLRRWALPLEQEDPNSDLKKHMEHGGRDPSWLRAPRPSRNADEVLPRGRRLIQMTLHPVHCLIL